MSFRNLIFIGLLLWLGISCKSKQDPAPNPIVTPTSFSFNSLKVNDAFSGFNYVNVNLKPEVKFTFSSPLNHATLAAGITFKSKSGENIPFSATLETGDSIVSVIPVSNLNALQTYSISATKALKSKTNGSLLNEVTVNLTTALDSTDKFPVIPDEELLTLVQKQTFKYFWDFAHPVSGLARERNTSGDIVTSGGSGFGIMAIPVAIERKFITRAQGLERMQKIVTFLNEKAQKFHGAFPHWLNGATGAVQPFSEKDNGADLVETSYLMQGLLTARQYFNGTDASETALRTNINALWQGVEWDWFRKSNENVLYWHWSPNYNWEMNHQIKGWNECLITYVLAASSPTHSIPKSVYDNGWAGNSNFANGKSYYGITLPLGEPYGGPLFYSQYSFLGLNPTGLTDRFANYFTQNKNHTLINYNYCITNPQSFEGYSDQCWGLTASDIPNGYNANSPTNDKGVITPTAALSAFPYTPVESMKALKFFYYKLGDKLWGEFGFHDAFSLSELWFADSYLAIDQGPIVIMIENHRSGLPWKLFMSCPEVKTGLKQLGFTSPDI
ncbi:glucoamylase family protein [Dyadobacter sp. CY323]|uniref:glucoamylase family protein n=1 Tax=Dyadobacter sp. CY323 TaxID=2907302 RepID=UPI001F2DC1AE|nr:glucoamylase family protein [Dyadobacter sp. CY323]MCE6988318.1 Ig-like domain-containing protein [Dyadobacter sp. CY323]